jgi:hypothetical protein
MLGPTFWLSDSEEVYGVVSTLKRAAFSLHDAKIITLAEEVSMLEKIDKVYNVSTLA